MRRLMEYLDASAVAQWCAFTVLVAWSVLCVLWRRWGR